MSTNLKIFVSIIFLGVFFYIPNDISYYFPILLSLILIFFYKFNLRKKTTHIHNPFFLLFFLLFYAVIIVLYQSQIDIFFLKTLGKIIIIATGIKVTIDIFNLSLPQNLMSLFWVLFINVLVTLTQYFDPLGLSEWAFSLNTTFIKHEIYFRDFRAMGLSAGYDSNGILLALSFHILILLIYNEKNTLKRRIFLSCSILNFIAVFITARVGVLALILGLLLLTIQKKEKISDKLSPYLKLTLPILLLIVTIFSINPKGRVSGTMDFIFEPFINYAKYNEFRTQSTDALIKDHYKLPHTKSVLFFGNGYDNAHPFYGANTDVGYLQIIFGLGIVGLCILLATYLFWFRLILKNLRGSVSGLFRDINLFAFNYIIIIFVNSFKGPYLLSYTLIFLFSFTFFLSEKFKTQSKQIICVSNK